MAAYDPYYADVVLLLRGNGADNSQTITDEIGHSVNVYGNTCVKTATKKYGSGSLYFDGNGDYLEISPADYVFGTGDFTLDGWINLNDVSSDRTILANRSSTGATHWIFGVNSAQKLSFSYFTIPYASTISVPLNEWVFVAACRASGTLRMYINGDQCFETSLTASLGTTVTGLRVGARADVAQHWVGYMDDVRITKYARYTGPSHRVPIAEASTSNVPPDITLTSIAPDKGPTSGGTTVVLQGSGFTDYTTCTIDGNSLTNIITVSDTELTGLTPPGTLGFKDVEVTNP